MALPTLSKTHKFRNNQAFAASGTVLTNSRNVMVALKESMIGNGSWTDATGAGTSAPAPFTIGYSCSSAVAGSANDGVDRWGTTITNLVWATAGSAHSWFVFKKNDGGTTQILISLEAASANGVLLTVAMSVNAGFTGGSTTARPTATDEVVFLSSAAWGAEAADAAHRLHVQTSTDYQTFRAVICSGGFVSGVCVIDKAASPVTGWTYPYVSLWSGSSVAGTTIATYAILYSAAAARGYVTASMSLFFTGESTGTNHICISQTVANSLSSEMPLPGIGLFSTTASHVGRHGSMFDLYWGLQVQAEGDNYPASGTVRQFAQFSDLVFPWDTSVIQTS